MTLPVASNPSPASSPERPDLHPPSTIIITRDEEEQEEESEEASFSTISGLSTHPPPSLPLAAPPPAMPSSLALPCLLLRSLFLFCLRPLRRDPLPPSSLSQDSLQALSVPLFYTHVISEQLCLGLQNNPPKYSSPLPLGL